MAACITAEPEVEVVTIQQRTQSRYSQRSQTGDDPKHEAENVTNTIHVVSIMCPYLMIIVVSTINLFKFMLSMRKLSLHSSKAPQYTKSPPLIKDEFAEFYLGN